MHFRLHFSLSYAAFYTSGRALSMCSSGLDCCQERAFTFCASAFEPADKLLHRTGGERAAIRYQKKQQRNVSMYCPPNTHETDVQQCPLPSYLQVNSSIASCTCSHPQVSSRI